MFRERFRHRIERYCVLGLISRFSKDFEFQFDLVDAVIHVHFVLVAFCWLAVIDTSVETTNYSRLGCRHVVNNPRQISVTIFRSPRKKSIFFDETAKNVQLSEPCCPDNS